MNTPDTAELQGRRWDWRRYPKWFLACMGLLALWAFVGVPLIAMLLW